MRRHDYYVEKRVSDIFEFGKPANLFDGVPSELWPQRARALAEKEWRQSRAYDEVQLEESTAWCHDHLEPGVKVTIGGMFVKLTRQELLEFVADAATWLSNNPE